MICQWRSRRAGQPGAPAPFSTSISNSRSRTPRKFLTATRVTMRLRSACACFDTLSSFAVVPNASGIAAPCRVRRGTARGATARRNFGSTVAVTSFGVTSSTHRRTMARATAEYGRAGSRIENVADPRRRVDGQRWCGQRIAQPGASLGIETAGPFGVGKPEAHFGCDVLARSGEIGTIQLERMDCDVPL